MFGVLFQLRSIFRSGLRCLAGCLLFLSPLVFNGEEQAASPKQPPERKTEAESGNQQIKPQNFLPGKESNQDQLQLLDKFLALPPDRLSRIKKTIEDIENLSPEEREAVRSRLNHYRKMDPEKQRVLRERYSSGRNHEERRTLMRRFQTMSPQQRVEEQKRVAQMSPEDRKEYMNNVSKRTRSSKHLRMPRPAPPNDSNKDEEEVIGRQQKPSFADDLGEK